MYKNISAFSFLSSFGHLCFYLSERHASKLLLWKELSEASCCCWAGPLSLHHHGFWCRRALTEGWPLWADPGVAPLAHHVPDASESGLWFLVVVLCL